MPGDGRAPTFELDDHPVSRDLDQRHAAVERVAGDAPLEVDDHEAPGWILGPGMRIQVQRREPCLQVRGQRVERRHRARVRPRQRCRARCVVRPGFALQRTHFAAEVLRCVRRRIRGEGIPAEPGQQGDVRHQQQHDPGCPARALRGSERRVRRFEPARAEHAPGAIGALQRVVDEAHPPAPSVGVPEAGSAESRCTNVLSPA